MLTHHMQMMTSAIYGHDLAPAVLADEKGNVVRVESAASPEWLERLFRPVRRMCFQGIHTCFGLCARKPFLFLCS